MHELACGTKSTFRNVNLMSAFGGNSEVANFSPDFGFDPQEK